jgi:hypothetical protein
VPQRAGAMLGVHGLPSKLPLVGRIIGSIRGRYRACG